MRRALCLAWLVVTLAGCTETEEIEVEVGFRGEARTDHLLMVRDWARELGCEAETVRDWRGAPARGSVLIADATSWTSPGPDADALLDWVDGGGHLVLCVFGFENYTDLDDEDDSRVSGRARTLAAMLSRQPVLEALGVELLEEPAASTRWARPGIDWSLDLPDVPGFRARHEPLATPRIGDAEQANLLAFELGAGRVTVLSSGWWMTNKAFAKTRHQHPEVLWSLIGEDALRGGVTLMHRGAPTLLSLLLDRLGLALLAGLVLLGLWLWRSSGRFGPRFEEPPHEQRAFHEHVAASGRFLWRRRRGQVLRDAFRAEVNRRAERRLPLGLAHDPERLAETLAERTGMSTRRVHAALLDEPFDPSTYTRTIADLQSIRASL